MENQFLILGHCPAPLSKRTDPKITIILRADHVPAQIEQVLHCPIILILQFEPISSESAEAAMSYGFNLPSPAFDREYKFE